MPTDSPLGSSALIEQALRELDGSAVETVGELFRRLAGRSHGVMMLLVSLPSLLPVPLGLGAVLGPLMVLLGLQVLFAKVHPWLPRWLAERPINASKLVGSWQRVAPWLRRAERFCFPRYTHLTAGLWRRLSGAMFVLLGALFALPIPLSNYPLGFGAILIALALSEEDGLLAIMAGIYAVLTIALLALLWSGAWHWLTA